VFIAGGDKYESAVDLVAVAGLSSISFVFIIGTPLAAAVLIHRILL
jgi:hypothetical protein